jgi:hypothetical protein
LLNWIITGDLASLAAWRTALMVEDEVQLKAGNATFEKFKKLFERSGGENCEAISDGA